MESDSRILRRSNRFDLLVGVHRELRNSFRV